MQWLSAVLLKSLCCAGLALPPKHGFIMKPVPRLMSLLLLRQIERLEHAIEHSTDWLEIQYLRAELDQIKDLYEEPSADAA